MAPTEGQIWLGVPRRSVDGSDPRGIDGAGADLDANYQRDLTMFVLVEANSSKGFGVFIRVA